MGELAVALWLWVFLLELVGSVVAQILSSTLALWVALWELVC
jgi:hypothetical protein